MLFSQKLAQDGYRINKVVTFGQPKILKRDEMNRLRSFDSLRVIDLNDPIPNHFYGYYRIKKSSASSQV